MALEPYALSVHHFISSVGADAGFASIIGLAVLVLLYFAQARETASLREQSEQAAERVAQLERQLARAAAVQASPAVAPAPLLQPNVIPGGVRPAAALATVSPSPPAGVAAPPLSAATKLIPTPPGVHISGGFAAARIAAATGRSPAAAAPAAANPSAAAPSAAAPSAAAPASATTAAGPVAPTVPPVVPVPASADPPAASPPPMNRIVTPRPATAAGGAIPTNGTGEHAAIPPPPPLPPRPPVKIRPGAGASSRMLSDLSAGSAGSPSDLTRILTALAAVAVVAAIVIVLLSVTSGGTSTHTTSHSPPRVSNAPTTTTHHHAGAAKSGAVVPSSLTVAVLNGTPVYHAADDIGNQLAADGFKKGAITNAATQTQTTTTVEYVPGDQRDAAAVAKALKLGAAAVQPITPGTQTLGCPQTTSCSVVVTVGADVANTQTQTQTQTTP